ncbi:hypothetical protein J437_LFUL015008 [Ladona fulva]|uniref:Uncharacterized protein n=1 Tax=Ladona fulva TaxID=123851 RepID=A0A8K0KL64_LADFU|nr:hypothetical protein J437_LFUL015008 [Ladona fulva]
MDYVFTLVILRIRKRRPSCGQEKDTAFGDINSTLCPPTRGVTNRLPPPIRLTFVPLVIFPIANAHLSIKQRRGPQEKHQYPQVQQATLQPCTSCTNPTILSTSFFCDDLEFNGRTIFLIFAVLAVASAQYLASPYAATGLYRTSSYHGNAYNVPLAYNSYPAVGAYNYPGRLVYA